MNGGLGSVFCSCKASRVALKDSGVILCSLHLALLFWKAILFMEESAALRLGKAVKNHLLAAAGSWSPACQGVGNEVVVEAQENTGN